MALLCYFLLLLSCFLSKFFSSLYATVLLYPLTYFFDIARMLQRIH